MDRPGDGQAREPEMVDQGPDEIQRQSAGGEEKTGGG